MSFVRSGDHICCLFESDEEHLSIAGRYIAEGLRQREHCLYSGASPAILRQFRDRLADEGVDVEEIIDTHPTAAAVQGTRGTVSPS